MLNTVLPYKVPECGKTARFYAILTWYRTHVSRVIFSSFLSGFPGRSRRRFSYSILF